jgi:hypothetical protein
VSYLRDIEHPTLCWKGKPNDLPAGRCTYPRGHEGRHQWERGDAGALDYNRGFLAGVKQQREEALRAARVPQPPADLLDHSSVRIAFESGWSAGFQEALTPDEHPDQDRCAVAFAEWQREVRDQSVPQPPAEKKKHE